MYRPRGSKIPLSRRPRERLELEADGSARSSSGARRSLRRAAGELARGRRGAGRRARASGHALRIVDQSPDRLVVRTGRTGDRRAEGTADHAHSQGKRWQKEGRACHSGVRRQRSRRAPGRRSAVPARPARAARPAAADLHARPVGVGSHWAASRRCTCPTRSSSRDRSARCSRSTAPARRRRSWPSRSTSTIRYLLLSSGLSPTPPNGRFHLQMVYAVCSLTYAAFRRALGRDIAWATTAPADGPHAARRAAVRLPRRQRRLQPRGRRPVVRLLHAPATRPAGFTLQGGLICTALSHDIIAHETTHALLDGLRSSFLMPTNVDVPAFHEGFCRSGRAVSALQLRRRRRAGDSRVARHASRAGRC